MARSPIIEPFHKRPLGHWRRYAVGGGDLTVAENGLRLQMQDAVASALSDAQLDEGQYPLARGQGWQPPLRLTVRARWSHPASALVGTSGFGFWNDPWAPGGFAAAPAWVWFAHYSAPSHVALDTRGYGHGPRAAVLATPSVNRLALTVGNLVLRVPGVARLAIAAAGQIVHANDLPLTADLTEWHAYCLEWRPSDVSFFVDGELLGASRTSPRGPLGFVAWMDNQWAALTPSGRAEGGFLACAGTQWLELGHLQVEPLALTSLAAGT